MNTVYIELIKKQIEDLDEKDYNLEVWQNVTSILLTRIFGDSNNYTQEIKTLKVEHNSWTLRDATADYNPKETYKQLGRKILKLAIAELKLSDQVNSTYDAVITMLQGRSDKLKLALTQKNEQALLALLKKENKDYLASTLVRLLLK